MPSIKSPLSTKIMTSNPHPLTDAPVDRTPVVKRNVLMALGTPPCMQKFCITNVFNDNFRITIYCWRENTSLLCGKENFIAHSIFVKADANGDIIKSDPPIQKMYQ